MISTREETREAVIAIAKEATRKVSIFTHDLEPGIYDDPDFLEIIKRLVLSQTYARIRVLIADPTRAIKNGNNFVHLGRRLNTYIEFRHVREDLRTHVGSAIKTRMAEDRDNSKRWVISTREETREAVIAIAKEATRKVSIFTHDLEPGIYDDPDFLEIIKRLVLSQTYARIRVLIADPTRAIKNGNNFVHLGRRLNTYIEFRHVREDLRT